MSTQNAVKHPTLKDYKELKQKHPDAVLLFRVGDFYEVLCHDAVIASKILGIEYHSTTREGMENDVIAEFPHNCLDTHLPKLVRAGKRVAIVEQLEDPCLSDKKVRRGQEP